jgi:hypothetical protein
LKQVANISKLLELVFTRVCLFVTQISQPDILNPTVDKWIVFNEESYLFLNTETEKVSIAIIVQSKHIKILDCTHLVTLHLVRDFALKKHSGPLFFPNCNCFYPKQTCAPLINELFKGILTFPTSIFE